MRHYFSFLLFVAALMLVPQESWAATKGHWEDKNLPGHEYNTITCDGEKLVFKVCVFDWYGCDAAFCGDCRNDSHAIHVKLSNDGGTTYTEVFFAATNYYGDYIASGIPNSTYRTKETKYSDNKTYTCVAGSGITRSWIENGSIDEKRWVETTITLNRQWRNCNISVYSYGDWLTWDCHDDYPSKSSKSRTASVESTYTHKVRTISWNGDISIAPDGTVTIPYSFEGTARNTDGETHICTSIGGSYNSKIGYKYPTANYSASFYTFKLSDIGKNMRSSSFTIEPYHEFTHYNDKGVNNNGTKYYTTWAGSKTFNPLPIATSFKGAFHQKDKKVTLTWKADNANYAGKGRWVIYRNNIRIADVAQSVTSYDDITYDNEKNEKYKIYYVLNGWPVTTCVSELCSSEITVKTQRTVPIKPIYANNCYVDSTVVADRIALVWASDAYPAGWGNKFNIYVDKETDPIYTIIPTAMQDTFRWEHRTTIQHTDRLNGTDGTTHYTEEPLNGSVPHTYRIEGVIGDKVFSTLSTEKLAIGTGTMIYQLDASKDAYAGRVKLSWNVNRAGSTLRQTYYVDRRTAGSTSDADYHNLHKFSSTDDYLFYTDETPLPGVYYEYRVTVEEVRPNGLNNDTLRRAASTIGFSQAYGTVSGRITYGTTGTAVANVEVKAKLLDNFDDSEQHHAVRLTDTKGKLIWNFPSETYAQHTFADNDWSIQMWINFDTIRYKRFLNIGNLSFGTRNDSVFYWQYGNLMHFVFGIKFSTNQYYHLTIVKDSETDSLHFWCISQEGEVRHLKYKEPIPTVDASALTILGFTGYTDEFRLWTRALTEQEILENYNHVLVGDERGLETYWTFDEGLTTQFFDYSRDGTIYHGHHGTMGSNTEPSNNVPEQLALRVKTDVNGNYVIRGIPFSGEGTTYAIEPSLGAHQFNPTQQLRVISNNSLVHNGTDFTDVSSFSVQGKVVYAGTSFPVTGCNLYVDGEICTKEGENVVTNNDGEFTISVPIGDHFIQVKKDGHVFANAGRYPKTDTHTFTEQIQNLTFVDSTLVNFTGRVVGGNVEGNKPVGFGLSKNNIGVATLTLTPNELAYSGTYSLNTTGDSVPVPSARKDIINSTAWRGKGLQANTVFIQTDPATGEFSAMLPPLDYTLNRIYVASSDLEILENAISLPLSDPQIQKYDSATVDTLSYYAYHTLLRQIYHSTPTFNVIQRRHEDGSFGMDSMEIEDGLGHKIQVTDIHHINADTVEYTYGYPLFRMLDPYFFDMEGYEQFVNRDNPNNPKVSKEPLANCIVTIDNELSSEQTVYSVDNEYGADAGSIMDLKSNQLVLDEEGKASYLWYGGLPKISGDHTRSLYIYYTVGERRMSWRKNPLTGIVLGSFPTGNDFVTGGPDHVNMVLRDPPGSQSFATWETGTVTTYTEINTIQNSVDTIKTGGAQLTPEISISGGKDVGNGTSIGISGSGSIGTNSQSGDGTTSEVVNSHTISTSVTATQAISTSDSPEYDGAEGDLFIGTATNHIIGDVKSLNLYWNPLDSSAYIGLKDNIGISVSFGTEFTYSQHYIVHDLLPGLKVARNSLLTPVADTSHVDTTGIGNTVLYVTQLPDTDPNYGESNTYKMIAPNISGKVFVDSVLYFNQQIANWKSILSDNEKEKWEAFSDRNGLETKGQATNHSFDAGSTITITTTTEASTVTVKESHRGWQHAWNEDSGFKIIGLGYRYYQEGHEYIDTIQTTESGTEESATFSYTLRDSDPDDAITVDVYSNQGLYGSPIFRTRGGKTSNPYEGEVRSKYYYPDQYIIMESTKQVEVPAISAAPTRRNDVPSGSVANFELRLDNNSHAGVDCTYKLYVVEQTNPKGAQLIVDGTPLTGEGRLVKVLYGQTLVKSLQLRQSDVSVFDYDDIVIKLESQYQSDIYDSVAISAQFVPSASPAVLAISTNTMNIAYDSIHNSCITLTMSGFDRAYHNQKAFRLQCKPQGGNWTDLHTFVINKNDSLSAQYAVLPQTGSTVPYKLNMSGFMDGTYRFRILSVSTYGLDEVTRESNEVELVKNLARPRPLGQAQPSDGILNIGDDVSVTYNVPFLSDELTKENFIVTGVLNGAPVEHHTALHAIGNSDTYAARTEAKINLSAKDYSIDAWFNIHSAGTLLRHGMDRQTMEIRTDENGHLVVAFFGDSVVYTSSAIVPRNKWVFLTLSRKVTAGSGLMSVSIAYDADTLSLFANKEVGPYYGNGPITVGLGAEADVHELLLWDEAHDMKTALAQRSVTKTPATQHLIGYWKMNEGEGKTIRDYARNRHMTMPEETWYINNINKAVALDGTQCIRINTGAHTQLSTDDYAVELWMQHAAQNDTAQLFQLGEVGMFINADGNIVLESNENRWAITNLQSPITNNTWHHIMLNVRRTGTAAVYVDGVRSLTIDADLIGSFTSDAMIVGAKRTTPSTYDRWFIGSVDEIRLWKTTIPSDLLASKRKTRLTGTEPGLSLYYPFEKTILDEYQQPLTVGTLEELTGNGIVAVIANANANAVYTDNAPALREKPTETNVAFDFAASDRTIVINLKEAPANIDGCTLNFTVKDIRSTNGNTSEPATWSAFVYRNELVWQDDELFVVKEGNENVTLSTAIINRSGKPQRWSLGDMPTSLIPSSTSGMLDPLQKEIITFRVNETAPIGKHERTIYAMGNNGIPTPLTIHLTVTGDVPDWSVAHGDYESAMYIVAQLNFFGKISDDEDDIVAAFIGDECRGVAQPEYKERYDGYYLTMTIYGNDATDGNKEVTFRAYDASSGLTYTLVTPSQPIAYDSWSVVGKYDNPLLLSVNDNIEQRTMLKQGWNWMSFYVTASDMNPKTVLDEIADDVILIKGQTNSDGFLMHSTNGWVGRMDTLRNSKMYAVKMNADRELRLVGKSVSPLTCSINLLKKWNWIGYYEQKRLTVANALAPMDPHDGDIIRSQRHLSYFDDFEWVGSLLYMDPGTGYVLYNTDEAKQFAYPGASVSAMPIHHSPFHAPASDFAPIDALTYPYNMVLVAQVLQAGEPLTNTEIGVFAEDECRAVGQTDDSGMMILLIQGEDSVTLTFKKQEGDRLYEAQTTLLYETDAIVGTADMPFIIKFEQLQGIDQINESANFGESRKLLRDGQLFIIRNGKTYTATGQEVK